MAKGMDLAKALRAENDVSRHFRCRDKFMNGLIVNLPVCRLVVYMVGTRNSHIGPVKIHPSTNYRDLPDTPRVFDVWRA